MYVKSNNDRIVDARSLGFDAAPLPLEEPMVVAPEPDIESADLPPMEGAESPSTSSGAKKKKKKKKKKSKGSIETPAVNGHSKEEEDEEEVNTVFNNSFIERNF